MGHSGEDYGAEEFAIFEVVGGAGVLADAEVLHRLEKVFEFILGDFSFGGVDAHALADAFVRRGPCARIDFGVSVYDEPSIGLPE